MTDDVELVMDEIVSNAVKAAHEAGLVSSLVSFGIELEPGNGSLLMWSWDASPKMPDLQEADVFAEGGRGLFIVRALCGEDEEGNPRMGVRPAPGGGLGKTVWARLPLSLTG